MRMIHKMFNTNTGKLNLWIYLLVQRYWSIVSDDYGAILASFEQNIDIQHFLLVCFYFIFYRQKDFIYEKIKRRKYINESNLIYRRNLIKEKLTFLEKTN